jgi:serine/threonine protein phosphatase PrpC
VSTEQPGSPSFDGATTVLRGRDHPTLGQHVIVDIERSLALAMSAGAQSGDATIGRNEDVGAIVVGPRASLLVVADGHFGCEASELAVEFVLTALSADPPPADISDEELVTVFFDAGVAVQRETAHVAHGRPESRTTLALALVSRDAVQWAALGDSCVLVTSQDDGGRLDVPRSAYLGQRFGISEMAAAMTRGRCRRDDVAGLVLATDGLVDSLGREMLDILSGMLSEPPQRGLAGQVAERLVMAALRRRATDALTVAVAL